MTQEKAKAYDEALEKAREYWETDNNNTLNIKAKETMEYLFPELRESESERIKNALIRFHKSTIYIDGIKGDEIVSWLKSTVNRSLAWSEEDMSKVQRICKYLNEAKKYYADITEVRECMDWLKSLKQRIGGKL